MLLNLWVDESTASAMGLYGLAARDWDDEALTLTGVRRDQLASLCSTTDVINRLVGTNTALAPLPGGSTNVYARSLGYPRRVRPAVECVLEALDTGRLHRVGVGSANGRRFLFHLGAGYDAAVVARSKNSSHFVCTAGGQPGWKWPSNSTHDPRGRVSLAWRSGL